MNFFSSTLLSISLLHLSLCSDVVESENVRHIHFENIELSELVKFIASTTDASILFNENDLKGSVSFISKNARQDEMMAALTKTLESQGLTCVKEGSCTQIVKSNSDTAIGKIFTNVKLQYHTGSDILQPMKSIARTMKKDDVDFQETIDSIEWIQSTNSLLFAATPKTSEHVKSLIEQLDKAQKQVFIEVLVIETDSKTGSDIGVNWSVQSRFKDNIAFGGSSTQISQNSKGLSSATPETGIADMFSSAGNFGIVGDVISFGGKLHSTITTLISALDHTMHSSIILNQKIMTQDNRESVFFDGNTVPFVGTFTELNGAAQQTTSNIEYRDIGISLNIKPLVGDNGIVTLEIKEALSEVIAQPITHQSAPVAGIETTKTEMDTRAHVPDGHFLVLSGMARNRKVTKRASIPVLGSIPLLGRLFSEKKQSTDKRDIIIFIRPHIVKNFTDELLPKPNQQL